MTARELVMWEIADCISPIGDLRGDLQAGQIANIILACNGGDPLKLNSYEIKGKAPSKVRAAKRRKGSVGIQLADMLGLKVIPHGGGHQKC